MRVVKLNIKNYRSFGPTGQEIAFPSVHCALVGKNNAGKSNIFRVLGLLLGQKSPGWAEFGEEDFFDPALPIELEVTLGDITAADQSNLFALPNLTKPQKGALASKIRTGALEITLFLRRNLVPVEPSDDEEEEDSTADAFDIKLWGFKVHRRTEDVRHALMRLMTVPAFRNTEKELSASAWTPYGQLMKEVLENYPQYNEIRDLLTALNAKIQDAFATQKDQLLKNARVVSFVDDIEFKLTKEGHPSELLRNLEIFIKEGGRLFNLENVGTGTQSAILIGILELALKQKYGNYKLFCIEEPEAFIHPHGVRHLGTLIKGVSGAQNMQVLVSTHSPALVANFEPHEIVRVDKGASGTEIKQCLTLDPVHFKKFINQDNADIFFSDKIVLVEGPTEKILFSQLDKITPKDPANAAAGNCSFDRSNIGVIVLSSKDSVLNYKKIADGFGIPCVALLDKDFIPAPVCRRLCQELGVTHQTTNPATLIADLKTKGIVILSCGEIEDVFPDTDVAAMSGKTVADVAAAKAQHPNKTSEAFKKIFGIGSKSEYALKIAEYYVINGNGAHPLADTIRKLESGNAPSITL